MFSILFCCCSEDGEGSSVAFCFFYLIYCGCFLDGQLREIPLLYLGMCMICFVIGWVVVSLCS